MVYPLTTLICLPLAGAVCCAATPRRMPGLALGFAVVTAAAELALLILLAFGGDSTLPGVVAESGFAATAGFEYSEHYRWVPAFGLSLHFGLDGLSLYPLLITALLVPISLVLSRHQGAATQTRPFATAPKELAAALLLLEASLAAVFLSLDLLLFVGLCQLALLLLLFILGSELEDGATGVVGMAATARRSAAVKFAVFNLVGTSALLIGVLFLKSKANHLTGMNSFDYADLHGLSLPFEQEVWLLLAFCLCFAIQLPLFPFHGWFADACAAAPKPALALLAGSWSLVGLYGFVRFCLPLFPRAAELLSDYGALLATISIFYGGLLALVQTEAKRRIAFACLSVNGLLLLGLCSGTVDGIHGSIVHMSNHGLSRAALLLLAAVMCERIGFEGMGPGVTDHGQARSLWVGARRIPLLTVCWLASSLAFVGMPGSGGFPGQLLILTGAYDAFPAVAAAALVGAIISAMAVAGLFHRLCTAAASLEDSVAGTADLRWRHVLCLAPAFALMILPGLSPQPLMLDRTEQVARRVGTVVVEDAPPAPEENQVAANVPAPRSPALPVSVPPSPE